MLHLKQLDELTLHNEMLVFASEHQGTHDYAIPQVELNSPAPSVFQDSGGSWEPEGCSLVDFLRCYVALNRVYDAPCTGGPLWIEDETVPALKATWDPHEVVMRSWQAAPITYWTRKDAVAILLPDFDDDGDTLELGAKSHEGFVEAIRELGLDEDDA